MAKFKYKALTTEGQKRSGVVSAETMAQARRDLAAQGVSVQELTLTSGFLSMEIGRSKVPPQEVMHLSRQLAAFLRAGVPIFDAISTIAEESGNKKLQSVLQDISEGLRSGATLSSTFAEHPSVFPRFFIDMLKAAELTGQLDLVLDQIAAYLERDLDARQKIRSALAYPLVIFAMSLVTVAVLTIFVIPRFEAFFESLDAELPLVTRILLGATAFVSNWWWAMLGVVLVLGLSVYFASRTQGGKEARDRFILKIPIVGEIVKYIIIERFCRILGSMVQAGVPLPEAMTVASEGTNNALYEKGLSQVREQMLEGEGLSGPITRSHLFPPSVTQMIRVGEDTGTLDQQLTVSAEFYESELGYKIKKMTTLFEPAVITMMGFFVGFVAVAVVSAMYGIFRQVGSLGG